MELLLALPLLFAAPLDGSCPPQDDRLGSWVSAISEAVGPSYRVEVSSEPAVVQPGRETLLRIRVFDKNGRAVTRFDDLHSQAMHFIVASEDLVDFRHLHPAIQPDGTLVVRTTFPRAVAYEVVAEFDPAGDAGDQTIRSVFTAPGAVSFPHSLEDDLRASREAGYRKSLPGGIEAVVTGGPLEAGKGGHLTFSLRDDQGRTLTDLEPLMGMPGHLIVFSEDRKTFQHLHGMGMAEGTIPRPDHATEIPPILLSGMGDAAAASDPHAGHGGAPPAPAADPHAGHGGAPPPVADPHAGHGAGGLAPADIGFEITVPAPGRYKVWGQFQRNGEVVTADFTLSVN